MILIVGFNSFAQNTKKPCSPNIFYDESTGSLAYTGKMNDEIWSYLNEKEIKLYDSCLTMLGLNRETVKWYTSELFYTLRKDRDYCSIKVVALREPARLINENNIPGRNKLSQPECILMITRIAGQFDEVSIQMFF